MKTTKDGLMMKFFTDKSEIYLCKKAAWKLDSINLFDKEYESFFALSNLKRQNEFLGVRHLRNQYNSALEIGYSEQGKPFFIDSSKHLSISHSKNYIALAISYNCIGIDIEECDERIFRVANRFLSNSEKLILDLNSCEQLTIAWCVKEALFKLNDSIRIDFKKDIQIKEIKANSTVSAIMKQNSQWIEKELKYEAIDNLIMCYNFE
jgi:phosphopantetheinyl transferase